MGLRWVSSRFDTSQIAVLIDACLAGAVEASRQSQIMWLLPAASQPSASPPSPTNPPDSRQQVVDQGISEAIQTGVEDLTALGPEDVDPVAAVDAGALKNHALCGVGDPARVVEVAGRAVGAPGDRQVLDVDVVVEVEVQELVEARIGLVKPEFCGDRVQVGRIHQVVQVDVAQQGQNG